MLKNILEKIDCYEISFSQWISSFIGVLFIRFILEFISSPTRTRIIASDIYTIIHYGLFWITLVLGLIIIVGFFSNRYLLTSKLALFGLPAIWLGPIIDFIASSGNGFTQTYIFDSHQALITDYFSFFGPSLTVGVTYGLRVEILLILIGVGWYLWTVKKSILRIILGLICVYTFGFVLGSLPGIIYTLTHLFMSENSQTVYVYLKEIIFQSNILHNTLREGPLSVSILRFFELGFNKLWSQILFVLSCILSVVVFWKLNREKFIVIIKNIRVERIGSYLSLLLCGVGFAYINNLGGNVIWVDFLGVICMLISWLGLWMFAVHNNDIEDVKIDTISNTERPLVNKRISEKDMRESGYVWLVVGLLGSWCAGYYPFFMSLVFIAASHIYSSPPLRLRRFPIIPSFLIGIASLATILAGFFFVSINKQIQIFPKLLTFGIVLMATLAINVKDMKDIEGDKKNGVISLPILFKEQGKKIVAFCFFLSIFLVPFFLKEYYLLLISIPFAVIGYMLVLKKPYKEEPIFILRFVFLFMLGIFYILLQ